MTLQELSDRVEKSAAPHAQHIVVEVSRRLRPIDDVSLLVGTVKEPLIVLTIEKER